MKCVTCAKREPETPQVCDPCRWLMGLRLREIPVLAEQLAASVALYVDDDPRAGSPDQAVRIRLRLPGYHDPISASLPSGPVPGARNAPRVSGSRERGVPERFDLLAPAYPQRDGTCDLWHDQVGGPSVAAILDSWCQDWSTYPWSRGDWLPDPPEIKALADWLEIRLDDACDQHPAIQEFSAELGEIHLALRRTNGLTEPKPELAVGVPCKSCGLRTIYKTPGYYECDPDEKCGGCQALLTEAEFKAWSALNAGHLCGHKYIDDDRAWWCALAKGHDGDCEPYREEEAA